MRDVLVRFVTAVVFVSLMLCGLFAGSVGLFILFAIIYALSIWECLGLLTLHTANKGGNVLFNNIFVSLLGFGIYLISVGYLLNVVPTSALFLIIPLIGFLFCKEVFDSAEHPFVRLGFNLMAILYITVPCIAANAITNLNGEYLTGRIFGVFLLVWMYDSGAYFVGRAIGKTPFFNHISPKKTLEGAFGGALNSFVFAYIASLYVPCYSLGVWLGCAAIAVVFGTTGDLLVSKLKRSLGVKDSGRLLPGHGGILDRFDAVFFALPFMYAWVAFMLSN